MLELNKIYNCDCRDGLEQLDNNSVDLTVCSPPYDNLRSYHDDEFAWNFDIFKEVADELYRVTKPGGVVVWVVGDEVVNGGETGTSFRQALYFQEIGFKIHDTMIYEKNSSTFPARINSKRYSQIFEYMFVFTKGKIRDDIKLIADKRNKWAGWTNWGTKTQYDQTGNLVSNKKNIKPTPEFSLRTNIWKYNVSFNDKTGHPAVFPEKLAEDHILSWSNEGDVVLDPFMGSGTTAKMAMLNKRKYIGFEKNADYYEVSLKRVGKYEGQINEAVGTVCVNDSDGNEMTLQRNYESDKEEAGKTEIFNNIVTQLNEYLNDMSLSILKTLKLTFASKANDRRVEEVLKERGISGYTKEEVVEQIKEPAKLVASTVAQKQADEEAPKKEPYITPTCEAKADDIIEISDKNVIEKSAEFNNLDDAFKVYHDDKDAFVRDALRIEPNGSTFKNGIVKDSMVLPSEKIPDNKALTLEEAVNNEIRKIIGDPQSFVELMNWIREQKRLSENGKTPIDIHDCIKPIEAPHPNFDLHPVEDYLLPEDQCKPVEEKRKRGRPKGSKNKPKAILNNPIDFTENE